MPEEGICVCCKARADTHRLIACCICKETYLHSCIYFSASEVRTIKAKGKSISWTCRSCLQVGADINELKAIIVSLKNEISQLRQKCSQENTPLEGECFEEILLEFREREKRKSNVVIYGVNECSNVDATAVDNYDKQKVIDILSCMSVCSDTKKNSASG